MNVLEYPKDVKKERKERRGEMLMLFNQKLEEVMRYSDYANRFTIKDKEADYNGLAKLDSYTRYG